MLVLVAGVLELSAPTAAANPRERGAFKALVRTGVRAFEDRKYRKAVRAFRAAYQLRADPTLLYNIGQCFERLGRIEDAIPYYEAYMAAPGTTSADRSEALRRVRRLRQEARARARMRVLPKVEERSAPPRVLPTVPATVPSGDVTGGGSELVIVVHASNKIKGFTPAEVRRIYLGKMKRWSDGTPVRAFSRPVRSLAGRAFFSRATGLEFRAYQRHWQKTQLMGSGLAPTQKSDVDALVREVAAIPGAIGFAVRSELPVGQDGVRVVAMR